MLDRVVEFKELSEGGDDQGKAKSKPKSRSSQSRRPGTKEEKEEALAIHNVHVLSLLSHHQSMSFAADDRLLQVRVERIETNEMELSLFSLVCNLIIGTE